MTDGSGDIDRPTEGRLRVVLLGLDGFPHGAVRPDRTPNLWRLGLDGGRAADGGRPPLPSTTYPGFATLLTGILPRHHGVRTTSHRPGAVPGWAGRRRVRVATLLDMCLAAGFPARVVLGDHKLHRVLRVPAMPVWPPAGRVPSGTVVDAYGYPTNEAVEPHLLAAAADPAVRFLFAHLNEADTIGHDHGPESAATVACHRATDAIVGRLVDVLRPGWDRTVLIVVSDHDMDGRLPAPPIDPLADIEGACIEDWIADGEAAWVRLARGADATSVRAALSALDGVADVRLEGHRRLIALAAPGRVFTGDAHAGGVHGGAGTERTVAIVSGGHGSVGRLAASIARRPPHLADWAPTIAALLGSQLPIAGLGSSEAGPTDRGVDLLQTCDGPGR